MATLTIRTLYEYDKTIFDGLRLPSISDIDPSLTVSPVAFKLDKDVLINKIIFDTLGLSVAYPATDDMKDAIKTWSDTSFETWRRLYAAWVLQYNPIWNVDGEETLKHEGGFESHNDATNKHDVTGYDTMTYSADTRDTGDGNADGTDHYTDTRKRAGNIGVTSTQSLILQEAEVAQMNLYNFIADSFKRNFCICVY